MTCDCPLLQLLKRKCGLTQCQEKICYMPLKVNSNPLTVTGFSFLYPLYHSVSFTVRASVTVLEQLRPELFLAISSWCWCATGCPWHDSLCCRHSCTCVPSIGAACWLWRPISGTRPTGWISTHRHRPRFWAVGIGQAGDGASHDAAS